MIKLKQTMNWIVIPVIMAFIMASSVCLQFLPVPAEAASMALPEMGMNGCHQMIKVMVDNSVRHYSASETDATDCCLSQHSVSSLSSDEIDYSDGLGVISPVIVYSESDLKTFKLKYQTVFLPPPEADSLRSIVKKE